MLALAGYLESAGERRRVGELLAPVLERLPVGEARVRAWLLLAGSGVETSADYRRHLARVLTRRAILAAAS